MRRSIFVAGIMVWCVATGIAARQLSVGVEKQPDKTYTSTTEVAAMIEKAKSESANGQSSNISQRILQLTPYNVNLEYRPKVGPAAIHEQEAELFYVVDGAGTLVTGGKLVNEKRTNPGNLTGSAIEGGEAQHVGKGDFFMVPENTAHWFSAIDGKLVLMTVHVPRPVTTNP